MKTLITGASGRVGRRLVEALAADGHQVRALVIAGDPGAEWLAERDVELVEGNLGEGEVLRRAVRGVDHVVHLAAVMDWTEAAPRTTFEPNVGGTVSLLQALLEEDVRPRRVVLASSDEVYPSLEAEEIPIPETHPRNPWSFYGLTKLMNEEAAAFFHRAHGLPTAVARFALIAEAPEILTPTGWSGRFLFRDPMRAMLAGMGRDDAVAVLDANPPEDPGGLLIPRDVSGESYLFQICDVRDLIAGLRLMLEVPEAVGETFNLSGPAPFTFEHAVKRLHAATGIPYNLADLPGEPIRVAHSIAKANELLGYSPRFDIDAIIDDAVARQGDQAPAN